MAMTRGFSRIILVKYSVGSLAHRKYLTLALVTGSSYKLEAIVGHGIGLLPGLPTAVWGKRLPSAAQCCPVLLHWTREIRFLHLSEGDNTSFKGRGEK